MAQTRREFLKRGAASGALVWSAPAIMTLSRAHAQQGTPCPGCTNSAFGLQLSTMLTGTDTFGENGCEAELEESGVEATVICGETGMPCSASASVATLEVNAGGVELVASAITSSAQAACDCSTGPSGSASVADAKIEAAGVEQTFNGALPCNLVVVDDATLGIRIVLNEQTCDGDVLTVNAIHVTVVGVIDLIVAQSRAGVAGCGCTPCGGAASTAEKEGSEGAGEDLVDESESASVESAEPPQQEPPQQEPPQEEPLQEEPPQEEPQPEPEGGEPTPSASP